MIALIDSSEIVLAQLEIPLDTVRYAMKLAAKSGKKTILNPAPAVPLEDELLKTLYLITPNETETEILTGIKVTDRTSARKAAEFLLGKGVSVVIITLGASGAYVFDGSVEEQIPAPNVEAVDTTAAGDTFNGALAVALADNRPIIEAVRFANQAAARTVTKMGAQSSIPFLSELL
jgi:ribokinase